MTRSRARATGAVYLLYFLAVIFATFLVGRVPIAYSDVANLIANAGYVVVTVLLYQIFKPVNRNLALLAVIISLLGCTVQSLSLIHLTSPRSSLPIFGLFNLTIGYLIVRSTFLPRVLGVLMALSGLGWLTVLSPELVKHIGTYVEIAGVAAEGCLMLWLLVMGVNVQRWNEQAANMRVVAVLIMFLAAVAAAAGSAVGSTRGADVVHVSVWNHHVYVPVTVNGSRRLWFLLDTGAGVPVTLIDKDVARSAGLRTIAIKKAGAIGGNIDLALTAPAALTIGEISLKSMVFAELPLKTQEAAEGHAIDGILGYDFLRRFIVDLDYPRQLMTLSTWRVPSGVTTVRMAIEGKVPHIDSVVINRGQKASARVILDTGEDAGLLVNRAFYDTHKSFLPLSAPKIGRGLGGASKNASSEADALEIGGVSIRSIPVTVNLDTVGNLKSESDAGLIGGAVLDRLHIIFDYGNGFFSISPIRAD